MPSQPRTDPYDDEPLIEPPAQPVADEEADRAEDAMIRWLYREDY